MGLLNAEVEAGETIFQSAFQPNPASAIDVLAFVLTRPEAFVTNRTDPDELEAVRCLLGEAKAEAIMRWARLNRR